MVVTSQLTIMPQLTCDKYKANSNALAYAEHSLLSVNLWWVNIR